MNDDEGINFEDQLVS